MKIGDLVQVKPCPPQRMLDPVCECAFCTTDSSRIGIVTNTVPLTNDYWIVHFDFGEWRLGRFDFEDGDAWVVPPLDDAWAVQ